MQHERFNHDYWHCEGAECGVKEDCVLYLALMEARQLQLKGYKVITRCDGGEHYVKVHIEKPERMVGKGGGR